MAPSPYAGHTVTAITQVGITLCLSLDMCPYVPNVVLSCTKENNTLKFNQVFKQVICFEKLCV